ncbi:MAG: YHYH protein [Verrucomicrobiota bacterium]
MSLNPQIANQPTAADAYLFGIAVNGVPFEPGTAETWEGNHDWREEAKTADGKKRLGLDENNAHVQPTGLYHYHGIPWGLIAELRKDNPRAGIDEPLLVGWAADGFAIYYLEGLRSSWRLKTGKRPGSPRGPGGSYDGLYTADYEYLAKSGDLDYYNGRFDATAENPEGEYRYYLTDDFPFLSRYFVGFPDESFSKHRGGSGGHPGHMPPPPHGSSGHSFSRHGPPPHRF